MNDELPPGLGGEQAIEAMQRSFDAMLRWQKTPEGQRARRKWESEELAKQRAARKQLCDLRNIPDDVEVRRWALNPHPTGPLFKAVSEAIRWKLDKEVQLGGFVPAMRFLLGVPGTGKTSALAWAVASWPNRAQYITADALCRSKEESVWIEAARVSLLVIDELGVEPTPDRVVELMLQRWSKGKLTLCGSNLSAKEIIDRYMAGAGARLLDRLAHQKANGLHAQVKADGPSFRGQKIRPEDF